jgi:hypothetical protein
MVLVGMVVLGAFTVFMCAGAFGAEDSTTVGVTVKVPPTIQLSVSGGPVDYGSLPPGSTNTSKTLAVGINSNKTWNLFVAKNHDLQNGTNLIPSADFKFLGEGAGSGVTIDAGAYTEFGGTNTQIAHGTRGASRNLTVRYSLMVPWDVEGDDANSYTATHTYTATQP